MAPRRRPLQPCSPACCNKACSSHPDTAARQPGSYRARRLALPESYRVRNHKEFGSVQPCLQRACLSMAPARPPAWPPAPNRADLKRLQGETPGRTGAGWSRVKPVSPVSRAFRPFRRGRPDGAERRSKGAVEGGSSSWATRPAQPPCLHAPCNQPTSPFNNRFRSNFSPSPPPAPPSDPRGEKLLRAMCIFNCTSTLPPRRLLPRGRAGRGWPPRTT